MISFNMLIFSNVKTANFLNILNFFLSSLFANVKSFNVKLHKVVNVGIRYETIKILTTFKALTSPLGLTREGGGYFNSRARP